MTPLPLRYVANIFCRRRSRAIFTVACLLVFGLLAASTMTAWNDVELEVDWEAEFERARRESLRDHMSFYVAGRAQLRPVPVEWTARDRCPACFGTDMCDPVDRQVLQSTISPDFLFSLSLSLSLSLVCVLCLFRQVQASNDASLLYHELFSLYVHIPRRCSSSSLSSYQCLPRVLVPSIPSKTVRRMDSLLNT